MIPGFGLLGSYGISVAPVQGIYIFEEKSDEMQKLNLPEYSFRIVEEGGKTKIFDRFRKKMVVLTPEEWVRQNFVMFLTTEKHYPESLISVEAALKVVSRSKRTDVVVYNRNLLPLLIVECKAPHIKINTAVFDQIVRYNISLHVHFLVVTNGMEHYCCKLDYQNNTYSFLSDIPAFKDLE